MVINVKHHFISGLPRSGSTLLAGLLRQNPEFHAAMSSPVAALMNSSLELMGANSEYYSMFDADKRREMCKSLFSTYYSEFEGKTVFDTNRIWTARLHQLVDLFDDFRMICCVRNPAWIMDSFERIYRKNPFDYSRMFNAASRMTVYTRCESLMNAASTVGSAWTALKEAYYGEFSDRLLLVDYELLTQYPHRTMELISEFLGVGVYDYDFNQVEYDESEFDLRLGVKGLHQVKRKVEFKPRSTILPPDLFSKYQEMDFWQDTHGTEAHIVAQQRSSSE